MALSRPLFHGTSRRETSSSLPFFSFLRAVTVMDCTFFFFFFYSERRALIDLYPDVSLPFPLPFLCRQTFLEKCFPLPPLFEVDPLEVVPRLSKMSRFSLLPLNGCDQSKETGLQALSSISFFPSENRRARHFPSLNIDGIALFFSCRVDGFEIIPFSSLPHPRIASYFRALFLDFPSPQFCERTPPSRLSLFFLSL